MEIPVLPEPNYPVSPEQFIGRKTPSEAFTLALQLGLAAGRISSFAVLGDWGNRRFAESLLDGLAEALAVTSSLTTRATY